MQWDAGAYIAGAVTVPLLLYTGYLQQQLSGHPVSVLTVLILAVGGIGVFAFIVWRILSSTREIWSRTLGLEAEMAAAEEINRLMLSGYTTFHDVPGGKEFNIDHVIVGPAGVFAVETKGRAKRAKGSGKAGATVRYDGHALDFPQWRETRPLEQAVANAAWVRDWLSKAVGEPVPVRPILLLPGWWVERTARGEVMVGNAKEIEQMVTGSRPADRIPGVLQKRIVHQLDQRCRDVEPKAYSNK